MLPDDVLMEIFKLYVDRTIFTLRNTWHVLVNVCRRWRHLVYASPRRLDLRLTYCGHRPISEVLVAWPVLPVILVSSAYHLLDYLPAPELDPWWDNRIAALESEHYARIREIQILDVTDSRWERFAAAMQKPFPELTHLHVVLGHGDVVPALPDSFLGGSAPRLRALWLRNIPFPSIPKLLLSANGLVILSLDGIPDSGYISPDVMATALTAMTRLETLDLRFRSPRSRPDPASRPLPPPTPFVLPALVELKFEGVHEYLEDLLAPINAPLLHYLYIVFFMDLNSDLPQLHRLVDHAKEFKTYDHAELLISDLSIQLSLYPKTGLVDHHWLKLITIKCRVLEGQFSSLARVCSPSFPPISTLEELEIREDASSHWKGDTENAQWLELLDPFTALKNLYLTHGVAQRVCGALQELSGERATEVLPVLRNLFVRRSSLPPVQEAVVSFVAARQLSDHPIVVDRWK